jgi:hypothetical protein
MEFDLNRYRVFRNGESSWEADLRAILDDYQTAYFATVTPPVSKIEFVPSVGEGSPACVYPNEGRILVDQRFQNFPKLCCLLVLHELTNYKLALEHKRAIQYDESEFQSEIKRLWDAGAYAGLL